MILNDCGSENKEKLSYECEIQHEIETTQLSTTSHVILPINPVSVLGVVE